MYFKNWLIAFLFFLSPSLYAHTGGIVDSSLMSGLLHPLTGVDHLLVLMSVGICAAKQGGKALWLYPCLFFALMTVGALMNAYAVYVPFIEPLITLSIVFFGLLVSVNPKKLADILFVGISFFAIFHGYAHAAEVPADSSRAVYFSALILMSLLICLSGYLIGFGIEKRTRQLFLLLCLSSGLYYLAAG